MTDRERKRWLTGDGARLRAEVIKRLVAGKSLSDLSLDTADGRFDLRGFPFPQPGSSPISDGVRELEYVNEFTGASLQGLDLSGARMDHIRFFHCTIEDCVFEGAFTGDWRLWATSVSDSSFRMAELRGSSFGAWYEGKGNTFTRVDFTKSRMKAIATSAATYTDCNFSNAQLDGVNFWQSSLIRCKFAGRLRKVIFDGRLLGEEKPDPNPMLDVDLSEATLDACDFRGVKFDRVRLPVDPDLVLLTDKPLLDRARSLLPHSDELEVRIVRTIFEHMRRYFDMGGDVLLNMRDFHSGAALALETLRKAGWQD